MSAISDHRPLAIVTGAGRSQGIGTAICRALARMKTDIFFTYWRAHDQSLYRQEAEGYHELLTSLQEEGIRCACMEIDLGLAQSAAQIMDEAERSVGSATILVNNAAHDDLTAPFDQLDATIFDRYYAVNIRGTILLSIEFARRFSQSSGGRIINLTSGQGMGAMPGKLPYVTSKGAIEAFTVTFAAEVASRGITVNAVDPGATDTGWISADPDLKRSMLEHAPFGRIGQPEDAARLIAFLASDAAEWISGQVIRSRGGF